MTTTTIAQRIAAQFGNDGQRTQDEQGREIGDVCAEQGRESYAVCSRRGDTADYEYREVSASERRDLIRYLFADGSAIVQEATGGAWDIEGSTPFSWRDSE